MIERLAHFVVRRRKLVLAAFVVGVLAAAAAGSGLFARLGSQGYDNPKSDSATVNKLLVEKFGVSDPFVVLTVGTPNGVDAPGAKAAALAYQQQIAKLAGVDSVVSYWSAGNLAALRSTDGKAGQMLVYAAPGGSPFDLAKQITDHYTGAQPGGLAVAATGFGVLNNEINSQVKKDIAKAESIAIPLTVVLLTIVFGSMVSAGLPFIVAFGAILSSFLALFLVSLFTDVSVFALNLVTGLGLGLGIDYALLIVNRFREELHHDEDDVEGAVVRALSTAGRTVLVSGLTVAATMAALVVFPQYFLKSFAYAGVSVTLLAILSALVALPAVLAMLGKRVDKLKVRRGDLTPKEHGAWFRLANGVMHRPWPVLIGVVALLLVLAAPVLNVQFSQTDERVLPKGNPALVATQEQQQRFIGQNASPVDVVVQKGGVDLTAYGEQISRVKGIVRVVTPTSVIVNGVVVGPNPQPATFTSGPLSRIQATSDVASRTSAGIALVDSIRAVPSPAPDTLVGGGAAVYADSQRAISDALPWALGWIALTTMIVLFLYTGSVLLPLKAVGMNVLSLGATLGVVVWVFQYGHLQWLIGPYNVTGTVDTAMMVLTAVVAFALSMDYEVFLLSRIKEEHDAGRSTTEAVSIGLQRSGRIITAAALLIAVSFAAFITAGVTNVKQLGFGVSFAVLIDATVVRALLVPAFMRIAGRWNWWAPKPLRAVHAKFGLSD